MGLSWAARGAAAADRARRRMAKTGTNMSGHKLWSDDELDLLRELFPTMTYVQMAARIKGRSWMAIRHKCQEIGLSTKRRVWTGAKINKLRRVYTNGTVDEVIAAFPDIKQKHLTHIANNHGMHRPRRPFKITGVPVIDQIRSRAFDLGYSMPDIDQLAHCKNYFSKAMWQDGYLNHRAIARAIAALDGDVGAIWRTED